MDASSIRLNKHLANLGICARREVNQLLKDHIVTVNGKQVTEPGTRINPLKDDIRLNGEKMKKPKLVYYLLNKPKGYISTTADEFDRKNVTSLIPTNERIYPVGRLDKETTGLIILTNDGTLTNLMTHPRYQVHKVYKLTIAGKLHMTQLNSLKRGVLLNDGITSPAKVRILGEKPNVSYIEITLHEGKNRQIRRMCEALGIRLLDLERIKFGPIADASLKPGKFRELSTKELKLLRDAAVIK